MSQNFFKIIQYFCCLILVIGLSSCSVVEDKYNETKTQLDQKTAEMQQKFNDAKTKALETKKQIDNKVKDVKEMVDKFDKASEALGDAMDSVDKVTNFETDAEALDVMDSIKTEE